MSKQFSIEHLNIPVIVVKDAQLLATNAAARALLDPDLRLAQWRDWLDSYGLLTPTATSVLVKLYDARRVRLQTFLIGTNAENAQLLAVIKTIAAPDSLETQEAEREITFRVPASTLPAQDTNSGDRPTKLSTDLQLLANSLGKRLQAISCVISLYNQLHQRFVTQAIYTDSSTVTPVIPDTFSPQTASLIWEKLTREHQSIFIGDITAPKWRELITPQELTAMQQLHVRSMLVIPLVNNEELLGIVSLRFREVLDTISPFYSALIDGIASYAAMVITNERLLSEVRRRNYELETLLQVGQQVAFQFDLERVLEFIAKRALELFDAHNSEIYLLDQDGVTLRPVAACGSHEDRLSDFVLRVGEGIVGWVVEHRQAQLVNDVHADPRALSVSEEPNVSQENMIAAPLQIDNNLTGVIVVTRVNKPPFTEADLRFCVNLAQQASIAISHARLFESERQQRERTETLRHVEQMLITSLDIDEVLTHILEQVSRVINYDSSNVMLLEGDKFIIRASTRLGELAKLPSITNVVLSRGKTPTLDYVVDNGRPLVIPDTSKSDKWIHIPKSADIGSWIGMPLKVRGKTIGVLSLNSIQRDFYDQSQASLLTSFAMQAAIAIDNAKLLQTERKRREYSETLRQIGQMLSGTLDIETILDIILEQLQRIVPYDNAVVFLWDDSHIVVRAGQFNTQPEEAQQLLGRTFALDELAHVADELYQGETVIVPNTFDDPAWVRLTEIKDIVCWLGVPLMASGKFIGYFSLDKTETDFYTLEHAELLEDFAQQAAIAIENAHLYQKLEKQLLREQELNRVSADIAAQLDLSELLPRIVTSAIRMVEAAGGAIALWNPETDELKFEYIHPFTDLNNFVLESAQEVLGEVIISQQPLIVHDQARLKRVCPEFVEAGLRCALAFPLVVGDKTLGILSVFNMDATKHFAERDTAAIEGIARQAAVAIENAKLYEQVRTQVRELERNQVQLQAAARMATAADLAGGFAHEVNNALTPLLLATQMLKIQHTDPELRADLELLHKQAVRISRHVQRVIAFTEMRKFEFKAFDVNALAQEALAAIANWCEQVDIEVMLDLAPDLPFIKGDYIALRQTLTHIINNAVEAMPRGGKLVVKTEPYPTHAKHICIEVRDTGMGIEAEDLKRVFDLYYTTKIEEDGRMRGIGVGLFVASNIVQTHQGYIDIESEPGRGTTVTVVLPIDPERGSLRD